MINGTWKKVATWVAIGLPLATGLSGFTYGLSERLSDAKLGAEVEARKVADATLKEAIDSVKADTKELPGFIAELRIVMTKLGLDGK